MLGILVPIVIGIGAPLLGVPVMLLLAHRFGAFFHRPLEVAADGAIDAFPEPVRVHF